MFNKSRRPFDDSSLSREPLLASEDFCSGNYTRALERSERLVRLAPHESWAWRFQGECLFALGRWAAADECFDRAIHLGGSGTADTRLWKAMTREHLGDLDGARAALEPLVEAAAEIPADVRAKAREHLRTLTPALAI